MKDKILIDTIIFLIPLDTDYKKVFWMFSSTHAQDCCEWHELDFDSSEQDFKMVQDMLTKIDKLEIYWEEWMWVTFYFYDWEKRVWVFVPWRWSNNWYYWNNITLIIKLPNWFTKEYDVTEYQDEN